MKNAERWLPWNHFKFWDAVDLGNDPKRESLQKWLGEAKGLFDSLGPGSKGLPGVFCTTQTIFCTGATPFRTSARGLLLAGSKRPFAPSPNHFRELSLFGQFPWSTASQFNLRKEKRHINLRKIIRTPAGCPWDTRRDKQGSTGRCPRNFLLFAIEKLTILPGHRPGVPETPGRSGGFQKFYVIFSYVPFLLPTIKVSDFFRFD